eukprot:6212484-Pleurochrysis_carterae.AAC.3
MEHAVPVSQPALLSARSTYNMDALKSKWKGMRHQQLTIRYTCKIHDMDVLKSIEKGGRSN